MLNPSIPDKQMNALVENPFSQEKKSMECVGTYTELTSRFHSYVIIVILKIFYNFMFLLIIYNIHIRIYIYVYIYIYKYIYIYMHVFNFLKVQTDLCEKEKRGHSFSCYQQ